MIELLITLGILGTIIGAAFPRLNVLQSEQQLDTAAHSISIAYIQAKARAGQPGSQTSVDQSRLSGGIVTLTEGDVDLTQTAANAGNRVFGTLLDFSDFDQGELSRLILREWQVNASTNETLISDWTKNPLFPELSSIHLSDRTFIDTDSGSATGWRVGQSMARPIGPLAIAFSTQDFGRPLYLVFRANVNGTARDFQPKISAASGSTVVLYVKRRNYNRSCRKVTMDLSRDTITVESVTDVAICAA